MIKERFSVQSTQIAVQVLVRMGVGALKQEQALSIVFVTGLTMVIDVNVSTNISIYSYAFIC